MNKKELDNWISLNFDDLLDVATNIISYRNYEPGVLINMTYEYLLEKINILTKKNIRSIAINWMNTNIKRQNTRIKSGRESECLRKNHLFDLDINLTNDEDESYVLREAMWKSIEEYKDVIEDPVMLSVYLLYIVRGFNSSSKLAKELKINRTYCSKWIGQLKKDILLYHNNNN